MSSGVLEADGIAEEVASGSFQSKLGMKKEQPWLLLPACIPPSHRTEAQWDMFVTLVRKHATEAYDHETYGLWIERLHWNRWGCTEAVLGLVADWDKKRNPNKWTTRSASKEAAHDEVFFGLERKEVQSMKTEGTAAGREHTLHRQVSIEPQVSSNAARHKRKQASTSHTRPRHNRGDDYTAGSDSDDESSTGNYRPSSDEGAHPSRAKKKKMSVTGSSDRSTGAMKKEEVDGDSDVEEVRVTGERKGHFGGLPWTAAQKYIMIEMIKDAGIGHANFESIYKAVNDAGGPGSIAKTKSRVAGAFRETHWEKFARANHRGAFSPTDTEIAYPDLGGRSSVAATAWSGIQIHVLWRGVMGKGQDAVKWEHVRAEVSKRGPHRKASDCRKTWIDTIQRHFGLKGGKRHVRG